MNLTQKLSKNLVKKGNPSELWWKGAVIYQIYPRSFNDSNNDGVGDINGITEKLDYLETLGVEAIWLSPFFKSPMKDFGYDVSDYKDVDPIFGTLEDFKIMIEKAHNCGIRIIIDQVLSHTSNEHPWFKESRKDKTNPKSDWYVWADAKADGTPPNNWLSIFGGSAWHWDTTRKQYYMKNFLVEQPDLNFHCEEVQDAILDTVRFWLNLGVDGFRLDTVNFYFCDKLLRDNPPRDALAESYADISEFNPYSMQEHVYDKTQIENIDFLKKFRKLLDEYPGSTSVGEVGAAHHSLKVISDYTKDNDKVHMCYSFDFLSENFSTKYFENTISKFENIVTDGWACWSLSNHDITRHITRWLKSKDITKDFALFCISFLISTRGTICLYQGEELGFNESELEYKDIIDPLGLTFWPEIKGRDGCRTPFAWDETENGGFSEVRPWLPVDSNHIKNAASKQINDLNSIFNAYKKILEFRKNSDTLKLGTIKAKAIDENVLEITRTYEKNTIILYLNFTNNSVTLPYDESKYSLVETISNNVKVENNTIFLGSFATCFMENRS
ncbi:alpha-amylase family glycosyl hydrolase [Arcobacter sp.]